MTSTQRREGAKVVRVGEYVGGGAGGESIFIAPNINPAHFKTAAIFKEAVGWLKKKDDDAGKMGKRKFERK